MAGVKGRLLVAVQFTCLVALVLAPRGEAATWRTTAARLLLAASAAVLVTAFVNLRPSVTVFPEPRDGVPFITHGIYRYVRHPMYLGVLLFGLAEVLAAWTPLSAALLLVLFIDLKLKHRYEDQLLAARWVQAADYQARVGALLPRLTR